VQADWNILWGFAGEPANEYAAMAERMPLLSHLPPPLAFGRIHVDRFSPCFEQADRMGFVDLSPSPAYEYVFPFPSESISTLAHVFTCSYADSRDVWSYVRPFLEAIETWRMRHLSGDLIAIDDGERLLIRDARPGGTHRWTELEGPRRTLYLACDTIQHVNRLRRTLERSDGSRPDREDVERLLQSPLLARNLLLREGDFYLALAIPFGSERPSRRRRSQMHRELRTRRLVESQETLLSRIRMSDGLDTTATIGRSELAALRREISERQVH
jgi:hypothetical protein